MRTILKALIVSLLVSCSPKAVVTSTHHESSDTVFKDSSIAVKPPTVKDSIDLYSYCRELWRLNSNSDTVIKYIPEYFTNTVIKVVVDSSGKAKLTAENDSLKVLAKIPTVTITVTDTVFVPDKIYYLKYKNIVLRDWLIVSILGFATLFIVIFKLKKI